MAVRHELKSLGDDTPAICGGRMPAFLRNDRVPGLPCDLDPVTADLIVLLKTNPHTVAFRANDLDSLDDCTKRALLKDLHRALGIAPLRSLSK